MPLPLPMLCSAVRWPFIMWNANKTPSRADWVVIWPAVSQIANHYRCLLSLVPSALCDSLSFWFSCRWQQLGMQRIPLRTPVVWPTASTSWGPRHGRGRGARPWPWSKGAAAVPLRKINGLNCCGKGSSINIAAIFWIRVRNTCTPPLAHIICSLSTDKQRKMNRPWVPDSGMHKNG